jgi:PIN domain nuclease of toxin-antitoxin system
MQHQDKMELLA